MAINETVTGQNSVAITGAATGGESIGVLGKGDTNGMQAKGPANGVFAKGKGWCGVVGISESTAGGFGGLCRQYRWGHWCGGEQARSGLAYMVKLRVSTMGLLACGVNIRALALGSRP